DLPPAVVLDQPADVEDGHPNGLRAGPWDTGFGRGGQGEPTRFAASGASASTRSLRSRRHGVGHFTTVTGATFSSSSLSLPASPTTTTTSFAGSIVAFASWTHSAGVTAAARASVRST